MTRIRVVFDGGARPKNPGIGYGSFIVWVNDKQISHVGPHVYGENLSNVEAEYITLVKALEWLTERFNPAEVELLIEGDSDLVRKQVGEFYRQLNGKVTWKGWKCNFEHLIHYRDTIRALLPTFKTVDYRYLNEKLVKEILGH